MSIKLKDTIYDLISNSDKLDGYHRSNLFESIPTWISASDLSKNITVAGNSSNFYPVVISVSLSKSMPTYISIYKDLGTTTPNLDGNHSNGTSSLWLRYEMRNTMWDGNGGYIKTLYKYQGYATLVAHTRTNTNGTGSLIVWLRGGTCAYTISCTNTFTVNIYYSDTNITGSSTHPDNVVPMTTVDNGGIYTSTIFGYGDLSGNASTASKLKTARTISLAGAITGTGTFDGSNDLTITTSVNHTHSYAGSSSSGGPATSANKLNTDAGGTTTPVYFMGGVPTVCSVASGAATASTIAVRNSSGDIYARLIRQTYEDQDTISGGIVYRINNSTDNYLRVCKSISAIRTYLGVPSSSDLSSYFPRQRMTNPDPGHDSVGAIPLILSLKSAGTPVYTDPEFKNGVNSCYVYNNSNNGTVTVSHITDDQNSGNSSGKILKISTTTGTASPGRGGFYQTMNSRAGAVFCQIFRAKIPTGFTLANNENSMGSGYKTYWMTNKAGTGKWEWYCRITICGTSGSFYSGGHVSLNNDEGDNVAVTWYLSYCNVIDLTRGHHDGLRTIYSDSSLCADKLGTFKLSDGTVTGVSAGEATKPVYFSGGVPTACTYSLNKTVPSDAKFTDTTYSAGTGLSLSGTTFNHTSSVTAGTAGTSSATSGSTFDVPYVTYNSTGHITVTGTHTHTISGFLSSSGGTITGTLTIKRNPSAIKYINDSDTVWGWLGFSDKNVGTLWESNGSTKHTLLHSGNYTSYAPSLNHGYGYVMKMTTIDASSLNANTYYPVIIPVSPYNKASIRVEVEVSLNSGKKPAWSTHGSGFSVRKVWETNGSGWGTSSVSRRVIVSTYNHAASDPVRGLGQLTNSSYEYVYVRGGGLYYFYTSHGVTPSLKTSTYTNSSQSVSPTTTAPAAIKESYSYDGHNHDDVYALKDHTHSYYYDYSISRTANTVLAAPNGENGSATFRKLVATDLPSHTHSYLPTAGGNMTSGARIASNGGNLYIGNSNNAGWLMVQDICSQNSAGDTYWSLRTNGTAHFTTLYLGGEQITFTT